MQEKIRKQLESIDVFNGHSSIIDWFITNGEYEELAVGEFFSKPGDPADHLIILLEGAIDIYFQDEDRRVDIFLLTAGTISGVLPYSRMVESRAYGQVIEAVQVLRVHRDLFPELVCLEYEFTGKLVSLMSDRVRRVSQTQYQDEKLKALGQISAGLAHELNNPASAIVRNAESLRDKLSSTPEKFKQVMLLNITPEETDRMNAIMFSKIEEFHQGNLDMTLMEREEKLDDLLDWLEDAQIEEADELAETFVDFGMTVSNLEEVKEVMGNRNIGAVLNWFDDRLSVERLVEEIHEGSCRVSELVQSIKSYSHMDQGTGRTTIDIHDGLRTTLSLLNHRFKQKRIKIDKQFDSDLPSIQGSPGELNQVWTNLFSNAIDAMDLDGQITISTKDTRNYIQVAIRDTGHGIPEDILSRIWEPFFTTKKMNEGTGIGLDIVKNIVQQHRGKIEVHTQPGDTTFTVSFLKK